VARFLRLSEPSHYYHLLAERLEWLRGMNPAEFPELFEQGGSEAK
jgi:hypothetical protein